MINNVGGYVGVGKYKYKTDRDVYKTWIHMLNRVHEQKGPYKGAKVCQDWLCFQKFAKWVFEDDNSNFHRGYQLDKDLKRYITNNDKVYCPENCVFLPERLNKFFSGLERRKSDNPKMIHFGGSYISIPQHNKILANIDYYRKYLLICIADAYYSKNMITSNVRDILYDVSNILYDVTNKEINKYVPKYMKERIEEMVMINVK